MPIPASAERLIKGLQPDFGAAVAAWLNDCLAERLPVVILEGVRSYERSDELYAQGRSKPGAVVTNARAGQSYHNFGLAVDAALADVEGRPDWTFDPMGPIWQRVVTLAKGRGLAWGGDWPRFRDYPHFQPAHPPTLADCRRRWAGGWLPRA